MSNLDELTEIFNHNKDKRICVLGTSCTGKSYLIKELGLGLDMDDEIFPKLTKEESEYVCMTPWTEEIGETMNRLVRTKLKICPGVPMFGTVLLDSDLIVYLHISDELLMERCNMRGVDFNNAKGMQQEIEREIENSNIKTIIIEVENTKKMDLKK